MQDDKLSETTRSELLERLRSLEGPQVSGSLAELAYRRAREALEKALEESRSIRLQAIDDARANREREQAALVESLKGLRDAAEAQIEALLREAEVQAEALRDEAQSEARSTLDRANVAAASTRAEAEALRAAAEERAREVERLEAAFDAQLEMIARRLGMRRPRKGLFGR
jgi:hypothetical protein